MKKFLSLCLFVLALLPVNGLLSFAEEVSTPETTLPEGPATEVPGTEGNEGESTPEEGEGEQVPPTEEEGNEGESTPGEGEQVPPTEGEGNEGESTPEAPTTNSYKLVANNFMVNVSELPEVQVCGLTKAPGCSGDYQSWSEEMVSYANPTLVEVDSEGQIVGIPEVEVSYGIKTIKAPEQFITGEGQYDITASATYWVDGDYQNAQVAETTIKLTVVSDDVFVDETHLAGIESATKQVVMTPAEINARKESWNPVTGINSVKYDAEAMVEDLFGAKVIGAGNAIDSQFVLGVKNADEISGIVNGKEGTYNINVAVGVKEESTPEVPTPETPGTEEPTPEEPGTQEPVVPETPEQGNGQEEGTVEGPQARVVGEFETLTLVVTNDVPTTPANPAPEVKPEAGNGVNTGVNNTTMVLLAVATIASVALILNRRK